MASFTIETRRKADGTTRYRVQVRIKEQGRIIYRESRTFSAQRPARSWGTARVSHLETHGVPKASPENDEITVGGLIRKYQDDDLWESCGRSKKFALNMIADCDIAKITAADLEQRHLVQFCRDRKSAGAGPATVNGDISFLRSIFKIAKPLWGMEINDTIFSEVLPVLRQMKLIDKSKRRTRRAARNEIDILLAELAKRENRGVIPFTDILTFSIYSCMRIGEVCNILWSDVNKERRTVIVRDRKDPRKKEGNHMVVPLLGEAWTIIARQPKTDERVFPYQSRSVTAGFQRVRAKIAVSNPDSDLADIGSLRYHDLRREGASRLFEAGFSIEEVAQVTGHRNLNTLWNVYRELYPEDLHSKYDSHT